MPVKFFGSHAAEKGKMSLLVCISKCFFMVFALVARNVYFTKEQNATSREAFLVTGGVVYYYTTG